MQDLTPGQRISQRFKLVSKQAQEHGQQIWLADVDDGPQQAQLRFSPGLSLAQVPAELKSEVRRSAKVVHPGLTRCLGLFEHDEGVVLAHEFVADSRPFQSSGKDYRQVIPALIPAAEALAYLHDLGLAHGGINEQALRTTAGNDGGSVVIEGMAAAWIEALQVPQRRADIAAFGGLLARLCGADDGTPLPENLAILLRSMQKASGGVADMHEVVRRLARVLDIDPDEAARPKALAGATAGAIPPQARGNRKIEQEFARPRPHQARAGISMAVALPALLLLAVAVVYVMFFMPRPELTPPSVAADSNNSTPAATAAGQSAEKLDVVAPFAAAASARLRQESQDATMSLLRSLVALEERGVSQWAPAEFAEARLAGDEGDALYREQEFTAALARYKEGLQLAESLIARSGEVLQTAIVNGNVALADGDAEQARAQFDLALAIDNENPEAMLGMERVAKLGEVLEKMRLAGEAERAGDFSLARDYYKEAVALDGDYSAAADALGRVQSRLGAISFQDLMSRGFRALERDDTDKASNLFEQAARLRPGASGPRDALAQVQVRLRDQDIATRREAAAAAERAEDWSRAVAAYQSVLQTDSTLVFAREGLTRAQQRELLAERMRRYIEEPLRMFDNQAYNEARAALAQARVVADPGPVLKEKIQQLEARVSVARTPVVVQLNSDNMTRVSIYKIGELGQFQQQSVGLIPGRYTAVGSRPGYRDVRREFEVRSNKPPPPVSIICEDPV